MKENGCMYFFIVIIVAYVGFATYKLQDKLFFTQEIKLNECSENIDISMFRGLKPNYKIKNVYELLGKEDDKITDPDEDGPRYDLLYYSEKGRIHIHASENSQNYEIGMVEFKPKHSINVSTFFTNINIKLENSTRRIKVFCSDLELIFFINSNQILEKVEMW